MNDKAAKPDAPTEPAEPAEPPRFDEPDKPSPQWFGAVILGCLALAAVWILTYTLSPLPGQHALGGWNYAIVGVLLSLFISLSMRWHGDPLEKSRQEARAARAKRSARAEQHGKGSATGSAG